MYFLLPKDIYVGKWDSDLIILDVQKDKYFSLTDQAAALFQAALKIEFTLAKNVYVPSKPLPLEAEPQLLNEMISHFIERGFIESADKEDTARPITGPSKSGGLANYQWDYKSSLAPFSKTSKRAILVALYTLFRVDSKLKKKGIAGVMDAIRKEVSTHKKYIIPSQEELKELSNSVDIACAFYSKKVYCLGWASTFVLLALKRGWRCSLAIGVQAVPFYAHAWAECDGKVINDETIVQEYLSILLREPFAE